MDRRWQEHLDALKRFNAWEAGSLREREEDYSGALAWLAEAWDLAARYSPARDPLRDREEHLEHLVRLRRALERAGLTP